MDRVMDHWCGLVSGVSSGFGRHIKPVGVGQWGHRHLGRTVKQFGSFGRNSRMNRQNRNGVNRFRNCAVNNGFMMNYNWGRFWVMGVVDHRLVAMVTMLIISG